MLRKCVNEILCSDGIKRTFESELEIKYRNFVDKADADGNRGEPKVRYEVSDITILTCDGKPYKARNENEKAVIENKIISMFK